MRKLSHPMATERRIGKGAGCLESTALANRCALPERWRLLSRATETTQPRPQGLAICWDRSSSLSCCAKFSSQTRRSEVSLCWELKGADPGRVQRGGGLWRANKSHPGREGKDKSDSKKCRGEAKSSWRVPGMGTQGSGARQGVGSPKLSSLHLPAEPDTQ